MLCGRLDERGFGGEWIHVYIWLSPLVDTCIHMAESFHCSPETITTLLIGHTPIQNKKNFLMY